MHNIKSSTIIMLMADKTSHNYKSKGKRKLEIYYKMPKLVYIKKNSTDGPTRLTSMSFIKPSTERYGA